MKDKLLFFALLLLFFTSLSLIDGRSFIDKYFPSASESVSNLYVDKFEDVNRHEAFFNKDSTGVVLTGSCQLEALWCTQDKLRPYCSIAGLLEKKIQEDNKSIRVHNMALPGQSLAHNLNTYLKFLNQKNMKVFIWHDEFGATPKENSLLSNKSLQKAAYIGELYHGLKTLNTIHPEISEIQEILNRIKIEVPLMNKPRNADIFKWNFNWRKDIFTVMKRNTDYLRFFRKRLESWITNFSSQKIYHDYEAQLKKNKITIFKKDFYPLPKKEILEANPKELYSDFFLVFNLVNKLNVIYTKKLFYYIGPEAQCATDDSYNHYFANPLRNMINKMPNISLIDMSSLTLTPKRDTFNCANLTITGNKKVSDHFYKILKKAKVFK